MDNEQPRPFAPGDEQVYRLTVEEAAALYKDAKFPRTSRAIQKYCKLGHLTCLREAMIYGERYRITPASVATHIEQLKQLKEANIRDQSRTDANVRSGDEAAEPMENEEPNVREQPRPAAADDRYVAQLEKENAFLHDQIGLKDRQIERRDVQIEAMIERDRETNILIESLQRRIPLPEGRRSEEPRPMHTYEPDEGEGDNSPPA